MTAGPYRTDDVCAFTLAARSGPQNSGGPGFCASPTRIAA